jgi:hypothetical protein
VVNYLETDRMAWGDAQFESRNLLQSGELSLSTLSQV